MKIYKKGNRIIVDFEGDRIISGNNPMISWSKEVEKKVQVINGIFEYVGDDPNNVAVHYNLGRRSNVHN